jgi:hypothetical protein
MVAVTKYTTLIPQVLSKSGVNDIHKNKTLNLACTTRIFLAKR